jgi:hypothetical protein
MAILYVSTDGTKWGAGLGRRLTVSEHDNNNWQISERLTTLEGATAVGITGFGITGATGAPGTLFTVEMSDGSSFGPYALPLAKFNSRGPFTGDTSYAPNDTFSINAALYMVNIAHVSAPAFNEGANDGSGNFYYSKLVDMPTASLPTGGATGYNLRKLSSNNFEVGWAPPLPVGGSTGYLLAKSSSADFVADWIEPPTPLPPSGGTGYLLAKASEVSYDYEWIAPPNSLPPSGATGYVLTKNSSDSYDVAWIAAPISLPAGGSTGYALVKNSSTDYDTSWAASAATPSMINVSASGGYIDLTPKDRAIYVTSLTADVTIRAFSPWIIGLFHIYIFDQTSIATTISFGSGIGSAGDLVTAGIYGRRYVLTFLGWGNSYYEVSRVGPLL